MKKMFMTVTATCKPSHMNTLQCVYDNLITENTAGVKCHNATFETDEGCVGATPGTTRYAKSPYGCSPGCVVCRVCLFWVCVPGGNGANGVDTELRQRMIASMTNRCVHWDEMKSKDAFSGKLINKTERT